MKRKAIILSAIVTLGVTTYIGNHLRAAQDQAQVQQAAVNIPQPPPPRTRIAVINLQQVVKSYDKWKNFEKVYKDHYDQFNAEFERRKAKALQLKADLAKPGLAPDNPERDKIQQEMRTLDREVQDLGEQAKKHLGKMQDDAAVQIYREVQMAVDAYARSHDLELVMHFNDAITPADMFNPVNIQRKLQTGACMPMYMTPGMDITTDVADMLNQRLRAMTPQTQPAAPQGNN